MTSNLRTLLALTQVIFTATQLMNNSSTTGDQSSPDYTKQNMPLYIYLGVMGGISLLGCCAIILCSKKSKSFFCGIKSEEKERLLHGNIHPDVSSGFNPIGIP